MLPEAPEYACLQHIAYKGKCKLHVLVRMCVYICKVRGQAYMDVPLFRGEREQQLPWNRAACLEAWLLLSWLSRVLLLTAPVPTRRSKKEP